MACGVCLGILVFYFIQAEHVCCSGATQAHSLHTQNGNKYVGFSQQDGRLMPGGSYRQNRFRQASVSPGSVQSSSLNTKTALKSGSSRLSFPSSNSPSVLQPARSPVRLMQRSSVSKPNGQTTKLKLLGLSSAIASGSSLSKYSPNQRDLTDIGERTLPVQRMQHTGKYLPSSSASIHSPRESYSFKPASHQSVAQKPPSAAPQSPAYYGQRGSSSVRSSGLFSAAAPAPHRNPLRTQTSVRALARRVYPHRKSEASKSQSFSSQTARAINKPYSQTAAGQPQNGARLFSVVQGRYEPPSMVSNHASQSSSSYKPGYTSGEQHLNSMNSVQASWTSRNPAQKHGDHLSSGTGTLGTSAKRYGPSRIYNIPHRYGGHAIRRPGKASDQKEVGVWKPQTLPSPPQQMVSHKPQVPSVVHEAKWKRVKLHRANQVQQDSMAE